MSWDAARRAKARVSLLNSPLLTKAEIQRRYGVSRRTIGRLIETGKLVAIRVGSVDRVPQADWNRYLQRNAR